MLPTKRRLRKWCRAWNACRSHCFDCLKATAAVCQHVMNSACSGLTFTATKSSALSLLCPQLPNPTERPLRKEAYSLQCKDMQFEIPLPHTHPQGPAPHPPPPTSCTHNQPTRNLQKRLIPSTPHRLKACVAAYRAAVYCVTLTSNLPIKKEARTHAHSHAHAHTHTHTHKHTPTQNTPAGTPPRTPTAALPFCHVHAQRAAALCGALGDAPWPPDQTHRPHPPPTPAQNACVCIVCVRVLRNMCFLLVHGPQIKHNAPTFRPLPRRMPVCVCENTC
jgi:hypothetical protein